jgi:hypothetical protein
MKVISLFGGSTRAKSLAVTAQRRLNCYYENRPDQDKAKVVIYGTPALVTAFTVAPALSPNPIIRALAGTDNSMYAVMGKYFARVNPANGVVMASGVMGTTSSNCEIALSTTQAVIVDGLKGYLFNIATGKLTVISPWQATGAQTVTFVSGFFVAEQPGTQNFWVSNAFDGSTWNALAFAAAATNSDSILAVDELNGNLVIFMTQSMEFWVNQGLFPEPFIPLPSAANTFGLAAINSRVHCDQAIIFLAESTQGIAQAARLDGYNVTIISDPDLEYIWNSYPQVANAVALTYQRNAHIFYQITFPSANNGAGESWLYDCSTHLWSTVQTGTSLQGARHQGQLSVYSSGQIFLSDPLINILYTMSDTQYTELGFPIMREIVTRHVLSNFNRVRISLLYLDMDVGQGLQNQLAQGYAPMVMIQYSKDNGHTWSNERWVSVGRAGAYMTRAVWRRFGSARDYVFKIRMTDPVPFIITDGAIKIAERQPAARLG